MASVAADITAAVEPVPVDRRQRLRELYQPLLSRLPTVLSFGALLTALVWGWETNLEDYVTAESGAGYALGIIGGVLMLLLLLYPLRKRIRWMRRLGPQRAWFRMHMLFGLLGPLAILYHCNFHLGSLNSNIALFCMLLVAGSGLVGRYFYAKIHYGLYGSVTTLKDLKQDREFSRDQLEDILAHAPALRQRLLDYEATALSKPRGILQGILRVLSIGLRTHWLHAQALSSIRRTLKQTARAEQWGRAEYRRRHREARRFLAAWLGAIRRVVELGLYERLFALWHVLHLPLFFMMIITAVFHVIAVHMF